MKPSEKSSFVRVISVTEIRSSLFNLSPLHKPQVRKRITKRRINVYENQCFWSDQINEYINVSVRDLNGELTILEVERRRFFLLGSFKSYNPLRLSLWLHRFSRRLFNLTFTRYSLSSQLCLIVFKKNISSISVCLLRNWVLFTLCSWLKRALIELKRRYWIFCQNCRLKLLWRLIHFALPAKLKIVAASFSARV